MNDTDLILAELRKLSSYVDFQRKVTRWALVAMGVTVLIGIVASSLIDRQLKTNFADVDKPDWYQVDQNVRMGDFDKAIKIGEELTQKTPLYPEAHHRLAGVYLAAGNLEKAKVQYAEACRLFPSEENQAAVMTIEKRIQTENPQH